MDEPSALAVPVWLALANIMLLVLWPIAWFAPLARAGVLPWIGLSEMSVLSGVSAIWEEDMLLAGLVAFFAIVTPLAKTLLLAGVHIKRLSRRAIPYLEIAGKLAMADVFLIAVYIVAAKGIGVGRIETDWGLYLFTFCVLASMLLTHLTKRAGRKP